MPNTYDLHRAGHTTLSPLIGLGLLLAYIPHLSPSGGTTLQCCFGPASLLLYMLTGYFIIRCQAAVRPIESEDDRL